MLVTLLSLVIVSDTMADFFDDDPFESIFEHFLERSRPGRGNSFIRGEDEERVSALIEDKQHVYLIFELPGYTEEDVSVTMRGRILELRVKKQTMEGIKEYLAQKLAAGLHYTRALPDFVSPQGFSYTMKHGVLEITCKKKGS